jgi:Ca2+/Na+ antiporter
MEKKNLSQLTDEQLIIEKKKLKRSKIMHALGIGFLIGILIFGSVSIIIGKNYWAILPLLFPVYFIYKLFKNSKQNNELEETLKERKLD